jgi:hypothetical protein
MFGYHDRLGNIGDGGKWVCYPNKLGGGVEQKPSPSCIVYSFGSNGDFSFETSIFQQNSECEVPFVLSIIHMTTSTAPR